MNIEERNVLTIVTIARIVENTLWYCLPSKEQSAFSNEERKMRYKALKDLTSEESPFYVNAKNNGEKGDELIEKMNYFIDDCYSDNGRIVTADINGNVHVEESLIIELYSSIVQLRSYLDAFLKSGLDFLRNNNQLETDFEKLIKDDMRYFHSFAAKVGSMLLVKKFNELNENARNYRNIYSQTHNGINPMNDPDFDVKNDPSFRMIENEFHELNMAFALDLNTYTEDDPEFKVARENVYQDSDIFTGKKKTTDFNKYFEIYTHYFDSIIAKTQDVLNNEFVEISKKVQNFETEYQKNTSSEKEEVNEDESK